MKKKTIMLLILIAIGIVDTNAQKTNWSAIGQSAVFLFDSAYIKLSNAYIIDTARKFSPVSIQLPGHVENFSVTGEHIRFDIFERSNNVVLKPFSMSFLFTDTLKKDGHSFLMKHLQAKVTVNNKIVDDWKDVVNYPKVFNDSIFENSKETLQSLYHIVDSYFKEGDSVKIEIRSKLSNELLMQANIKRIGLEPIPFLATMTHDSSVAKKDRDFVQRVISDKDAEFASINNFYKDWPGTGIDGNIGTYFPASKLAFFFRKPDPNFPDYTLEYNLSGTTLKDTGWYKTGHVLLITHLDAGANYKLKVRYASSPKNIWACTFNVKPYWYQSNLFKWAMATGAALALISLIFIFMYKTKAKKDKAKKDKLQIELKALRAQLNPHFVFNAMASIQGLINNNEIEAANRYMTSFSTLLRDSLKHNDKDFVSLAQEIKTIETYIRLEQLRFGFRYFINVDEKLNSNEIELPSLLIQPIIENAIKHGIAEMKDGGLLVLQFLKQEDNFIITINDNGKGIAGSPKEGFGLKLTRERIAFLNQYNKNQSIELNMQSDAGTTVTLVFKKWLA